MTDNPLLALWDGPHGLPPFDRIEEDHFVPAFEAAMASNREEIEAIVGDDAEPTFENTVEACERAGRTLGRVARVFFTLSAACTNPRIQEIEREIVPKLAAHNAAISGDPRLWARVKAGIEAGGLSDEQRQVAERYRRSFEASGADLADEGRARVVEIKTRLASIGTAFAQSVLKDEAEWHLPLAEADMGGLPDFLVEAARAEARARELDAPGAISLSRSSVEPFLTFSPRRDLRERAWRGWEGRGEAENWPRIAETLSLRAERAALLGHPDFATFKLEDQMAETPERVEALLTDVWGPAKAKAAEEEAALAALAAEDGINGPIEPWDWRYYAERVRKRDHDLDEAETKPFLAIDRVRDAAFDVAGRLFGLSFEALPDLTLHHPDAKAWAVTRDGEHVAIFVADDFARPSKRSGAWASGLRGQQKLWEPHRPIVMNTCNFAKADPCLLTWDDARTLFHEFGHALHAMLSDVTYPSVAGTGVARDFVELPSQLYEHWFQTPEVLAAHARHYKTGEPMPDALIEKVRAAETFNQGFRTVEFLGSAIVDLDMHRLSPEAAASADPKMIEGETLARIGMPGAIGMRHRSPHFQHVFSGDGYSAGYYSYLWSEVMDADAFEAFEETGDVFDPETARRLLDTILSVGGSVPAEEAFTAFRGRLPDLQPLLRGRGLKAAEAA